MDNKIYFRNNSKEQWNRYNVGGGAFVDIDAKSIICVGPKAAEVLRRNLCDKPLEGEKPKWLEEVAEKDLTPEERKSVNTSAEKIDNDEVEKIRVHEAKKNNKK